MKYRGIIFDLDGTLLDTVEDLQVAANKALTDYGYRELSYDETMDCLGKGFEQLLIDGMNKDQRKESDLNLVESMLEIFKDEYHKTYMNKTKAYDGILSLLRQLQEAGIKMAINTNKGQAYAINLVDKYFSNIGFVTVVGAGAGYNKKPSPEGAEEILRLMSVGREQVLYVGDSQVDLKTAENCGLDCAYVSWGFRSPDQVANLHHKYRVDRPEELLDIIGMETTK